NIIYENTVTRQNYVNILSKIKTEAKFNDLECPICYETYDNYGMLSTKKCGHYYCVNCILESIDHDKKCPSCRTYLDINELMYVDDLCKNNKANKLINLLNTIEGTNIFICVHTIKHKNYLTNY